MKITLDLEMIEPNVYSLTINGNYSGVDVGTEQADVTVDEIGDVVNDYISVRRKALGIEL